MKLTLTPQERTIVLLLAVVQFCHILDFMIMMPLGPTLMRVLSITPEEFGETVSIYSIASGVTSFLGIFFADKIERKKLLLLAFSGFLLGTAACAFASSYWQLLAARALTGGFGGVSGSVVMAAVAEAIPPQKRGSAMGIIMTAFSMSSTFGVPIGLVLANMWHWNTPFLILVGIGALVMPLFFFSFPKMPPPQKSGESFTPLLTLKEILWDRSHILGLSLNFLTFSAAMLIIPYMSDFFVHNIGFSEDDLKYIYLIGGVITFFSAPWLGKIADQKGYLITMTVLNLLCCLAAWNISHLGPSSFPIVILSTTAFMVVTSGRIPAIQALVSTRVSPHVMGGFMSLNSATQSLGIGCAAWLGSRLFHKESSGSLEGFSHNGWGAILLFLLGIAIALPLAKRPPRRSPPKSPDEAAVSH